MTLWFHHSDIQFEEKKGIKIGLFPNNRFSPFNISKTIYRHQTTLETKLKIILNIKSDHFLGNKLLS